MIINKWHIGHGSIFLHELLSDGTLCHYKRSNCLDIRRAYDLEDCDRGFKPSSESIPKFHRYQGIHAVLMQQL
jgi:hypothetical protein